MPQRSGFLYLTICGSALISLASGATMATESCGFLGLDPRSVNGGTLFSQTDSGWRQVEDPEHFTPGPSQSFAYFVQPSPVRQGAIVIKSGAVQDPASTDKSERVQLVINKQSLEPCSRDSSPRVTSVSSQSYAKFHDSGLKTDSEDTQKMHDFHIRYLRSGSTCVSTADTTTEGVLSFDGRSNRSQFSFDPGVVAKGQLSQISLMLFPTRTSEEFARLTNLRVEIFGYDTGKEAATCLRFTVPTAGAQMFMRIVDLEARDHRPPFPRLPEKSWQWRN